ncbi:MAG: hypothetical protein ACR2QJ_12490 [Geminicoccaceae bacterium]
MQFSAPEMATTAEGAETDDQAVFLDRVGLKEVQGIYYARPMPAVEMASIVAATNASPSSIGPDEPANREAS